MMCVHIRWLIERDLEEVERIEGRDSEWDSDTIRQYLRASHHIGMVAEYGERVIGWMLYALHDRHLKLDHLAVHPHYRLCGVGWAMLDRLTAKLSLEYRSRIIADVPEDLLPVQKFFRACGWRAACVVRGDPDLYRFVLGVGQPSVLIADCEGR